MTVKYNLSPFVGRRQLPRDEPAFARLTEAFKNGPETGPVNAHRRVRVVHDTKAVERVKMFNKVSIELTPGEITEIIQEKIQAVYGVKCKVSYTVQDHGDDRFGSSSYQLTSATVSLEGAPKLTNASR